MILICLVPRPQIFLRLDFLITAFRKGSPIFVARIKLFTELPTGSYTFLACSFTLIMGLRMILDFTELEIKHALSDRCKILSAFSRSFSCTMVTIGSRIISVIKNLPSTFSSFPTDLQLKSENSNLEFSAIAKKVVIRQLLTAAVNKCSGDQMPGMPLGNSGGVATSIQLFAFRFNSGEHIIPLRSWFQFTFTL
jgi:hypothetical protein